MKGVFVIYRVESVNSRSSRRRLSLCVSFVFWAQRCWLKYPVIKLFTMFLLHYVDFEATALVRHA